jgi:hypothetical protein
VFAAVQLQGDTDELGVTFDSFIVNPTQASKFVMFYGASTGAAILDASGLTMYSTNRVASGTAYFFEEGGVGELRFEKPLSTESWREPRPSAPGCRPTSAPSCTSPTPTRC